MLGAKLKEFRKSRNIRQTEFARSLRISQGFLSEVEQGKKIPGGDILKSLKQYYPDLNMNWLFTDGQRMLTSLSGEHGASENREALARLQGQLQAVEMENVRLKAKLEALSDTLMRVQSAPPAYTAEPQPRYQARRRTEDSQKVEVMDLKGLSPEAIQSLEVLLQELKEAVTPND